MCGIKMKLIGKIGNLEWNNLVGVLIFTCSKVVFLLLLVCYETCFKRRWFIKPKLHVLPNH